MRTLLLAAVAMGLFTTPAKAQVSRIELGQVADGYTYYNRPGSSVAEHNIALGECARDNYFGPTSASPQGLDAAVARGTRDAIRTPTIGTAVGEAIGSAIGSAVWGGALRGLAAAKVENCMLVRGWRVFRLQEPEGHRLRDASTTQFLAEMEALVGSATPAGVLVRFWNNDAAATGSIVTASMARDPGRQQLSARLFSDSGAAFTLPTQTQENYWRPSIPAAVNLSRLSQPRDGYGIILVRVVGRSGLMTFERQRALDGAEPFHSFAVQPSRSGRWVAFEALAGRWRLGRVRSVLLCLGSPAFDIGPGEIVYAGTFDLSGSIANPSLELDDVRTAIPLSDAAALRPAVYQNGSTGDCSPALPTYALEFPAAAFEPAYRWGSQAASPSS
ncbi:MAG: hypothetical protein Q7U72_07820 [Brevundimonas sp.]|uniref:hypothetical protein n=1 Tax=Brevundimonas sp. TaxID=1871086 RepID=UPI002716DF14|nr:hypothetical protein [Brevundimonas sp.]MDO9077343.1 hypothetical protein [Brevundimonas sp.]MDP3080048.1 hypothetical protein [Brevundimonas sp.]MDZ4059959.1 hypothetical protein [Brevundimonas sp.]